MTDALLQAIRISRAGVDDLGVYYPLTVAVGAIARKPAIVGDRVETREFLNLTLMFDHDVIDGAPMAMFLHRNVAARPRIT